MNFDQMEMENIVRWILNSNASSSNVVQRPYFLVIFNNRQWSDHFRQRRAEERVQRHPTFPVHVPSSSLDTIHQSLLDDQFNYDLHRLVDGYMRETQRTFPLKYFIDFTDH